MAFINKKIDIIDYLKGFSIFTIVLYHLICFYQFYIWNNVIKMASNLGGAGVHVFFVCSGFGLYLSYLNKPLTFRKFIIKRMSKIYIPYIFIVLVTALIPFIYAGKDRFTALLSHIFLFKMFVPKYESSFGGQLWFISTIIQFYLIFYLLISIKNKLGSKGFLIMSFGVSLLYGILVAIIGKADIRTWNSFFLQYLWEFSFGMVCVELYLKGRAYKVNMLKLLLISIVCLLITGFTGYMGGVYRIFNDYSSVVGYGGLLLFIYYLGINSINRFFIWISKFSYIWFLVHILTFEISYKLLAKYCPSLVLFIIVFILNIFVGYLCNRIYVKISNVLIYKHYRSNSGSKGEVETI